MIMMPYAELAHRCSSQSMQTSDTPHAAYQRLSGFGNVSERLRHR